MSSSFPIVVTGAAGFIGSRFVELCNLKSIPVISVDDLALFDKRPEHRAFDFGQKIDWRELPEWLDNQNVQIRGIIHLGAITDTRESDWNKLNEQNLDYSKTLWKAASQLSVPLVYASSAATYGDGAQGYDDDETRFSLLKPLNAYGESKLFFDQWVLEQEKQGKTPPAWSGFKFFNVYGFGERHKGFMASVVLHAFDQIQKEGRVTLFKSHREGIADGEQKRDFVCVEDVVQVLDFALHHPIRRGIYNLGTGKARSFRELTEAVYQALGKPAKIEFIDTPISIRDKYQYFTEATMARLHEAGFRAPFTSLEDGVARYVKRLSKPF